MADIVDLDRDQSNAVTDLLASRAAEQTTATPQQADVDSFNLTAGPLRRGLRSGFNQLGAMTDAFVSSVGEAAGLEQFAKQKMQDAEEYARFADSVSPEVRNFSEIKDFNDLAEYVQGVVGQSLATTAPALAGAVITRGVGLRSALPGAFAGSFIPNAGDQAMRLKDSGADPLDKLKNIITAGAGEAALDSLLPASVVGRVAKAARRGVKGATLAGGVVKGAAMEGATEGAQEAIGQLMAHDIDPEHNKLDLEAIKENAIQGAIGGGALGGGGRVAEAAVGLPASLMDLKGKQQTRDDVKRAFGDEPDIVDEFDDSDILLDDTVQTEQDVLDRISDKTEKSMEALGQLWDKVKENPKFQKYKDFPNDPAVRAEFIQALKDRANELHIKPRIESAYKRVEAVGKGVKNFFEKRNAKKGEKFAKQRTRLDLDIHDEVMNGLSSEAQKNLSPEQKLALSDYIKYFAMHEFGQREEVEGPGAPNQLTLREQMARGMSPEESTVEGERETLPRRLPDRVAALFADGENGFAGVLNRVNRQLARVDPSVQKQDFRKQVKEVSAMEKRRQTFFEDMILEHMRPEIKADEGARNEALRIAPRIVDDIFDENLEPKTKKRDEKPFITTNEEGKPTELQLGKKAAARRQQRENELDYVFGPNKENFIRALEAARPKITRDPETFFKGDDIDPSEMMDVVTLEGGEDGETESDFRKASAEEVREKFTAAVEDKRLAKTYGKLEDAVKAKASLEADHDPRLVAFEIEPTEKGTHQIVAKERAPDDAFSDDDWEQHIREPKEHGKTGLENGIITVRLKRKNPQYDPIKNPDVPKYISGGNQSNKVNIVSAVRRTMQTTPPSGSGDYIAEMVRRAITKIVSDPRVRTEGNDGPEGLPFTSEGSKGLIVNEDGSWNLPSNTLVFVDAKGKEYRWGQIVAASRAFSQAEVAKRIRAAIFNSEGPAQWGEPKEEGGPRKPLNARAKAIAALSRYFDGQRADREEANELHQQMLEQADGDPELLREAAETVEDMIAEYRSKDVRRFDPQTRETTIERYRPRFVSLLRGVVAQLDREAERISLVGSETEVGEGGPITDIQKDIAGRQKDTVRVVEGDTGIPLRKIGRSGGPSGELDSARTDRTPSEPKVTKTVLSPAEERRERAINAAGNRKRRSINAQTPSSVRSIPPKGKALGLRTDEEGNVVGRHLADIGEPAKKGKRQYILEDDMLPDFNKWKAKNPGGTVNQYIEEARSYKGKGKAALARKERVQRFFDKFNPRKKKGEEKLSAMNVSLDQELTPEQKAEVKNYLERVLGTETKKFFSKMKNAAGSFIVDEDGTETIRIAANAMDALGVARHEAAHALMARLIKADPKAAQTLLAAAGSPTVVTRLRQLLKDHPDALKQLSDPEERLAYMYQFWAAKKLTVGPNTKGWFDKIKGFFRKIAGIWSETYNNVQNMEKAEKVFQLFDTGRLSDRNTVAEVLRDTFPKTAFSKATELMGPVYKFAEKAFFTADAMVRGTNIPALVEIADKFYTPVGHQTKGPGFLQTRYLELNKRLNALTKVLEGTSEETRRLALETLQNEEDHADPKVQKVVQGVRDILNETFDYMTADKDNPVRAVVWNDEIKRYEEHDLKRVAKYFPRYYNRQAIADDPVKFMQALEKGGLSAEEAKSVTENILRQSKQAPDENDFQAGLTFYAPNSQARKLNIPTKFVAEFLHKDLEASLYSYLNYATRRAEYAKRFGNQGQKIQDALVQAKKEGMTEDQRTTFNQAVMAMEGSLGHDISPELKQIMGGVVTYQNFRLLPLALFTSLADPIGIAVRGGGLGEAFNAFVRGLKGIVKETKDDAYDMAALAGTISLSNDHHMLADAYGSQYLTEWQRKANNFFFRFNGMESWNRQMRIAATGAAAKFIVKHAAGFNEHSDRYLRELNLTREDVKTDKNGKLILNDKINTALAQWVDGAVLRPNAAIRPIWMSDPHYMLIAHLKQFTYSFQKTVVARVVHELENGNYSPALAMLSYVPMLIAVDMMRAMFTPGGGDDDTLERLGLGGLIWRGTQRAGLFGPGQYALDAYGDLGHDKIPLASIAGPTVQQLIDFGSAVAKGSGIGKELLKAIPGYVLVR